MKRLAAILLLAATPALAEEPKPFDEFLTPDAVEAVRAIALDNIHLADCGAGPQTCTPATDAERADPPVTLELTESAMRTGIVSGLMEWCGLNWTLRSFQPMLVHHREASTLSKRQMVMLALIHGIQQGQMREVLKGSECDAETRTALHADMPGQELDPGIE